MPQEINIVISQLSPFEIAAQFLGILVYPTDTAQRRRLILAKCRGYIERHVANNPEWARWPQVLRPEYLLCDPKRAETLRKQATRVMDQERMLSAEIARALIAEAIVKSKGRRGLMLRENGEDLAALTALDPLFTWGHRQQKPDDPDRVEWKTFQQRAWRESKPVLHLALAYWLAVRGKTTEELQTAYATLFDEPCGTRKLLDNAEVLRQVLLDIAQRGRFILSEEETVRVVAR